MDKAVKESLKEIVGDENFTDALVDLIAYSKNASEHGHGPEAAVWPTSAEQVSLIMKLANRETFAVVPRGAGTSLAGLAVPDKGVVIMDLGRMDKISDINIEDRLAVVQPGVMYADLEGALATDGFFFPPDSASGSVSTLGGNVATNAGGIKSAKYGTTKDYVLALEVVLPDGRILHTGGKCMKSASGYELTKLFVGSEGTIGVITEITIKISPKPPVTATAMATFGNLEDAGRAISGIMYSGILPSALEVLDQQVLQAINENTDLGLPEVEAMLVAETDGYTQEETEFQMNKVIEIFKKNNATTVEHADASAGASALWAARKSAYGVTANLVVEDLAVPMSKIPEMLHFIKELAGKYDLRIPTVGHAGDGKLHPVIIFDSTDSDQVRRVQETSGDLFKKVVELGGTLNGEHGIGSAKIPFMKLEHDDTSMQVMNSLKRLFDPNNILNPGKMGLEA